MLCDIQSLELTDKLELETIVQSEFANHGLC